MKKILLTFLALLYGGVSYGARCTDFSTQSEAQRYHDAQGGKTRLDRDKDGEACECLRGGSAYGSPKCRK